MMEIKNCPFCGGKAIIILKGLDTIQTKCLKCKVQRTQVVVNLSIEWLYEKMIEHWNTRQPPDMAEIERMVDEFERSIKAFFCPKYLSNSEGQLAIKKMNESRSALLAKIGGKR